MINGLSYKESSVWKEGGSEGSHLCVSQPTKQPPPKIKALNIPMVLNEEEEARFLSVVPSETVDMKASQEAIGTN